MASKLVLEGKSVRPIGNPPFEVVFTLKLADAVLHLPPVGDGVTIAYILNNLTQKSLHSFKTITQIDQQLYRRYHDLCAEHPQVALVTTKNRALPKSDEIVEELVVGDPVIGTILFTIDGERFVSPDVPPEMKLLMTFAEFEKNYGRTVAEHLEHTYNRLVDRYKRALELVNAKRQVFNVQILTKDLSVDNRKLVVYSEDQIDLYANRHRITITDTTKLSSKE